MDYTESKCLTVQSTWNYFCCIASQPLKNSPANPLYYIYIYIYTFNAVCLSQIFTNIFPWCQNFHQREQQKKISLPNALMYTLHQFSFQMEFCISQCNFLFFLWHIATCLWSSVCCYPLFRYSILVCTCWKLWVTKISPHHWRISLLKYRILHSNHLANSPLKPSSVSSLRMTLYSSLQRAEMSSWCWKGTAAKSSLYLSVKWWIAIQNCQNPLHLKFPACTETTWSIVLPPHTLRVD